MYENKASMLESLSAENENKTCAEPDQPIRCHTLEEGDPLACLHSPCKVVRVGLCAKTAVIACSTFSKCGCQEVCARGRTWARKCAQNWFAICRIKRPSGFCCSLSRIGQTSITSNKSESRTLIPKLSALASQRHKPNSRKKPTSWKHLPHQR